MSGQYSNSPFPIDQNKIYVSNSESTSDVNVSMQDASISNTSSTIIKFNLTETQRAKLILLSGTPGGDTVPTVLNVDDPGAATARGSERGRG